MSGVAIVRHLLASNATLTAQVVASKIFSGVIPIRTTLPAISVVQISGVPRHTVAMSESARFVTERVQVSVVAKSYASQKSLLALVRAALPLSRGTVNGFSCDSIVQDSEGPDIFDAEASIYEQSQDFIVRFTR